MEAELVSEVPGPGGWRYEPKWDGFRGVLENDGGELALWSRNGRPLLRYFPELREIGELLPPHSALDGEIVIAREGKLDFDAMQMRLHPAESRVRKLSAEIPATFVAFDLLLWQGKKVHDQPIEKRRAELEKVAHDQLKSAEDRSAALKDYKLVIRAKAGTEGKLFGSVGTADISEALKRENFNILRSEVRLPNGALRMVGDHTVNLHLHADIDVPLAVSIIAEE
jgi:ribosomal protein L9